MASKREVSIDVPGAKLEGTLVIPDSAEGLVVFAHGSGSSRHSSRNRYVAEELNANRIGTLLFDLLSPKEETIDHRTGEFRFNISFLAQRLIRVTHWLVKSPGMANLRIGYFGASTGAAAALVAAAELLDRISAVVSRGGRPDLAEDALGRVRAPTLLIVGGNDKPVIRMNQEALEKLSCPEKKLFVIPGATHLFEEAGALEEVAGLAVAWFHRHFAGTKSARGCQGA